MHDVWLRERIQHINFPQDANNYIPNLYLRSEFVPPEANTAIEVGLKELRHELKLCKALGPTKLCYNLSREQRATLATIQQDQRFITVNTDKN